MAAALALGAAPQASAALKWQKRCHGTFFECTKVSVPLDHSGATPGTIPLYVERTPGGGKEPVFALAGGPGQSNAANTESFSEGLGDTLAHGRYVVVPDQRGTGRSNVIVCPSLERPDKRPLDVRTADCADHIGPTHSLYTTRDSVDDLEAVRQAIGKDKIILYGVSYGTKVATAYALKYPQHVDRLILDSVVEPEGQNPFDLDTLAALPRVMREVCRGECRFDLAADLTTLAGRLASGPLRGPWVDRHGRRKTVSLTARDLYVLLRSGDLDPQTRAEYPSAIHAAVLGDPVPLLRIVHRFDGLKRRTRGPTPKQSAMSLSSGLFAATVCEEAPLPWERTATRDERIQQARDRAAAIPDSAFAPFSRAMTLTLDRDSLLFQCSRWPEAASPPTLAGLDQPFPDIPVLVLEGDEDLRTPLEVGQRLAARFPHSTVVQVPKTAHSVVGIARCLNKVFTRWFKDQALGSPCAKNKRPEQVRQAFEGKVAGAPARTAAAVAFTAEDVAHELGFLFGFRGVHTGGLRGGVFFQRAGKVHLKRVVVVPGVTVSGILAKGHTLTITGKAAAHGKLLFDGRTLRGRLGGKRVKARVNTDQL